MHSMKTLNVATVFSGIGSFEFALRRMGIPHEIVFACDNGEIEIQYDAEKEMAAIRNLKNIDEKCSYVKELYKKESGKKNFVEKSYLLNHPSQKSKFFYDVKLLDGTDFQNKIDIFVGGSPCQSFSSVGFKKGLQDARGTLFYEFARLVDEIKPEVFIYENVRNIVKHDNGHTLEVIKSAFNDIGYTFYLAVLNAADYGIPQTRRRFFAVGFKKKIDFAFPPSIPLKYKMKDFLIDNCAEGSFSFGEKGNLQIENKAGTVEKKYFLSPLLYNYVMKSGTKTFHQKPIINMPIARTLLKTMGNRHRAGIDNYVSIDGSSNLGKVRMLTERECHRLMGFTDDYKIETSRAQAYKQAGNSIVVDVMMAIIRQIISTGVFE